MVWETVPSINHCDTHGKGRVSRGSATPHPKRVALQRPQKCWDPLHAPTWYVPYVKQQTRYCMMKLMKPCPSQEFLWSTLTHYLFVIVDILVCSVWTSLYKVISCLWDNICRRWKTSFCVLFCNAELQISDISPAIWTCALPLVQLITRQQSISQNTWSLASNEMKLCLRWMLYLWSWLLCKQSIWYSVHIKNSMQCTAHQSKFLKHLVSVCRLLDMVKYSSALTDFFHNSRLLQNLDGY